jgi:hypothetical protein
LFEEDGVDGGTVDADAEGGTMLHVMLVLVLFADVEGP